MITLRIRFPTRAGARSCTGCSRRSGRLRQRREISRSALGARGPSCRADRRFAGPRRRPEPRAPRLTAAIVAEAAAAPTQLRERFPRWRALILTGRKLNHSDAVILSPCASPREVLGTLRAYRPQRGPWSCRGRERRARARRVDRSSWGTLVSAGLGPAPAGSRERARAAAVGGRPPSTRCADRAKGCDARREGAHGRHGRGVAGAWADVDAPYRARAARAAPWAREFVDSMITRLLEAYENYHMGCCRLDRRENHDVGRAAVRVPLESHGARWRHQGGKFRPRSAVPITREGDPVLFERTNRRARTVH